MIRDLLNIFVPEKIGDNYILSTTIAGVSIEQESLVATVVLLEGNTITLQKTVRQLFEDNKAARGTRVAAALTSLLKEIGRFDKLVVAIPSSLVVFKEISFPFNDYEKIKATLRYELEALLPFPINEACIDFFITKTYPNQTKADVMVAAVQQKLIEEHLKPFYDAKIEISTITVDVLGVYNVYLRTHLVETEKSKSAFLSFEPTTTKVLLFGNGQLKHIRTIAYGVEALKQDDLWNIIKFTLQSFTYENADSSPIEMIEAMGLDQSQAHIATQKLGTECQLFSAETFMKTVRIAPAKRQTVDLLSLGQTIPLLYASDFSLQAAESTHHNRNLAIRQVITACCLSLITLTVLAGHTFMQVRKLSGEIALSQDQMVKAVKDTFPGIKTKNRRDMLDLAAREVQNEAKIWSAFSTQTRQSFLNYLYQMSTKIDRETLGLNLKKMVINKNTITLEGSVRSFEAVEQFEHQLRETKLFKTVPDIQRIEFSVPLPLLLPGT